MPDSPASGSEREILHILLALALLNEDEHGEGSQLYVSRADIASLKGGGAQVISEGEQIGGETYYTRLRYNGFVFFNAYLLPHAVAKYAQPAR